MNVLARVSTGFILVLLAATLIVGNNRDLLDYTNEKSSLDYTVQDTIPVYRGSLIKGIVTTNATYILVLTIRSVDNKTISLLSRNLTRNGEVRPYSFKLSIANGGILFINAIPNYNTTGIRAMTFSLSFEVEVENLVLLKISFPYLAIASIILTVSILWWWFRGRGQSKFIFYGKRGNLDLLETGVPVIFSIVIFSYRIPNFIEYEEVYQMMLSDIVFRGFIFSGIYWSLLIFLGTIYLSRDVDSVREQWITYQGKEYTFLYRIVFALKNICLILSQVFVYYYIIFFHLFLAYPYSIRDWTGIISVIAVLIGAVIFHLSIFSVILFFSRKLEMVVFAVGYLSEALLRSVIHIPTLALTIFSEFLDGMQGYFDAIFPLLLSLPIYTFSFRRYIQSEVY